MENLLESCGRVFEKSIQPFGVTRLRTDADGEPIGLVYEYMNPSMAAMTGNVPEELIGKDIYELWPAGNEEWLAHFAAAVLEGKACEFEAPSPLLSDYFHVSVFPIQGAYCGFLVQNVTDWVDRVHASLVDAYADSSFDELRSDLELLKQQKTDLETALDLAEEGSRAKDAFLANVSHDFRTPMNAISGFAAIALDNLDEPGIVRDSLEKIQLSSNHLLDLVNDILDASRIQSGKLSISCEPLSMTEVITKIISMFSNQAASRGLGFKMDVDITHDAIIADKMRIAQVLMNVLSNAFKFTPDDGAVTLSVTEGSQPASNGALYTFTVSDTGCGMSEDFVKRVFDPFERSSSSLVSQTEGTGLGMTITKNLVDLMNGTIEVKSKLDEGTTITICLPLALDDGAEEAGSGRPSSRKVAEDGTIDFTGKRALVADDDDLSREVLMVILGRYGFQVDAVADGDEAVKAMQASSEGFYDVLLLDMRMARMNGDEAARAIRALDRADAKAVPIFVVTADAFDEVLEVIRDAGMTGRITKPLEVQVLLETLAACL